MISWFLFFASFLLAAFGQRISSRLFSPGINYKVSSSLNTSIDLGRFPQYTDDEGSWVYFPLDTFTSGFLPALGYAMHTRQQLCWPDSPFDWLDLSWSASTLLLPLIKETTVGHAIGFFSIPFVEELRINPDNEIAIAAVNGFAADLAERFDPAIGCVRSWDSPNPDFQVIIDTMMTIEVLFHAAKLTGNDALRDIAITHARTTMRNHIRSDGSSWHLIHYDSECAHVVFKTTTQGYADSSTWTRGQAWGIYGFAQVYGFTEDESFLNTARRMADYFLGQLSDDFVVPWDFDAPETDATDSPAAVVAANGLLMLAKYESDPDETDRWARAAINLLNAVTSARWPEPAESILSGATVNRNLTQSLGTIYGDYYYVQAGNRLLSMGLASC